ncbi:LOW QUALITY PROTEIN: zf-CCHC domain-containing protein/UBN2 domain-containing protein, partial [Cephalotus follicularis]
IINSFKNLEKCYPNQELVRKILRCLPKSWIAKVTAIEEAKDLTTLPLEQLLGSLMTYQTAMMNHESEETKKKKTVAFKASKEENEDRPFKKNIQKGESSKKEEVICYECNKSGHYKNDCPKLKKNKEHSKKKKGMMATLSDNDDSSSDEESDREAANIAFMAIENEEENEVQFSYSLDELQNVYDDLIYEFENNGLKNIALMKNITALSKENYSKNENSNNKNEIDVLNVSLKLSTDLKEKNENLKREVDALKNSFYIFSNSSKKSENLLGLQRCVFDK